jgi:uncharacterized protein (DUF305 family)
MSDKRNATQRRLRILLAAATLVAVGLLVAAGVLLFASQDRDGARESDSVDVGFSQDMSVHHLQGVQMANVARERSGDPLVRQLAFDIESSQLEQVGRMKGWLSMWNQPETSTGAPMTWMRPSPSHGQHGQAPPTPTSMPGMASSQELNALRTLTGPDFDTYFLQLMTRHHQGAAPMLHEATKRAIQPQVRNLAQQMLTAQSTESDVMKQMLLERGAQPLPAPN